MSLTDDDIVAICRPMKERAGDEAWSKAMLRLGGAQVEATDDAERIARSFTVFGFASQMGVEERTVWRWIKENKVVSFKTPGGGRRIDPADNGPMS